MEVPFLLSEAQMAVISPYFPLSHGVSRVDDRRVVSGIVLCDQERIAAAGCATKGYSPQQDALQPFHPLEPPEGV